MGERARPQDAQASGIALGRGAIRLPSLASFTSGPPQSPSETGLGHAEVKRSVPEDGHVAGTDTKPGLAPNDLRYR